MGVYDYGYGILIDKITFSTEGIVRLINKYGDEEIKNEFHDYVVNNITDEDTEEEVEQEFIDAYLSTMGDQGEWAVIEDLLHTRHPNMDFRCDDYCLFVGAYFPMDEKTKAEMPTTKAIQDAISELVNTDTAKIEDGAVKFDYYFIDDYS